MAGVIELSIHVERQEDAEAIVRKIRTEIGYLNACIRAWPMDEDISERLMAFEVKRFDC